MLATSGFLMTVVAGCAASVVLAPLLDAPPRPLRVVHRSPGAWQLADVSGQVVACLLSTDALRLPHGVVMSSALPVGGSPAVSIGAGGVRIAGTERRVTRWWRPARPRHADLAERIDAPAAGRIMHTWRSRLGVGDGLTPYADDVLCGALVALLAAGHPAGADLAAAVDAVDLEAATTATSAGLLRQAVHGRCIDGLADYLASLVGDEAGRSHCLAALTKIGHSSGRGMVEGVQRVVRDARRAPGSRDRTVVAA